MDGLAGPPDGVDGQSPPALLVGGACRLGPALAGAFAVATAPTAAAALAAVAVRVPALVVSALRLPDGDGLALAAAIEADPRTRGVPVVLLSSAAREDRALAAALAGAAVAGRPAPPAGDGRALADVHFVEAVTAVARERLDAPGFGAADLAAEVGIIARQLRRRLVEVTGEPPGAFLRRLRLQWAAALLDHGVRSVKEVAHRSGFASTSGFRAAFREAYGVAPSAYGRADGSRGE